jgi:hypothetical protein
MRSSRARLAARRLLPLVAAVPVGLIASFLIVVLTASAVLAADPSPTAAAGGDPRSSGQGPGLVGDPLFAIGIVVGIGLLALGATLLYVRMTGGAKQA